MGTIVNLIGGERNVKITVIKPEDNANSKKRVAAYCRVSTLKIEQEESFDAQVAYYTQLIGNNLSYELVGIYADQGISGTKMENRPEFMRMVDDALAGKIDIIYCKSISRFGRNAAQCQEMVRKLKAKMVEVIFEREQLSSFNPMSEMVFNFLTIIAEEESKSISENTIWALDKLAEKGIRRIGNSHAPYGYDEVGDKFVPNEKAYIIKFIFESYASEKQLYQIVKELNKMGAVRKVKKDAFTNLSVRKILQNVVYKGDRILQKGPHKNYITHQPDPTREYSTYYIKDAHEAIVSEELWEKCQEQRKINYKEKKYAHKVEKGEYTGIKLRKLPNSHPLFGKVMCAECGDYYERQIAYVAGERVYTWRCRGRSHHNGCKNHRIYETALLEKIAGVFNLDKVLVHEDGTIEVINNMMPLVNSIKESQTVI